MMTFHKLLTSSLLCFSVLLFFSCSQNSPLDESQIELSTNLESRSNDCFDVLPDDSCIEGEWVNTISLPSYPGCEFQVSVPTANCATLIGFGSTTLFLGEFTMNNNFCSEYTQDVEAAISNGTIDQFTLGINIQIWAEVTNSLLTSSVVTGDQVVFEYVQGDCTKTCYEYTEPNPLGLTGIIPVTENCGTNCCRVQRRYSLQGDGNYIPTGVRLMTPEVRCSGFTFDCIIDGPGSSICSGGCEAVLSF